MDWWAILLIVSIVLCIAGVAIYFLNRWAGKKQAQQNDIIAQHKQTVSLYVIDKKKDKLANANFPKEMVAQVPRMGRMFKMPLVKVKIGPQITTMMCEENTFNILPVKKTVSVEIAGAYIVGMKGQKTKMQLEQQRKSRRKSAEAVDAPPTWRDKLRARFGK
ncbi:MAG: hypothetical protein FWC70_09440 [Defluviitaleaceae bacterium]|nr:hypothetical protein [Defluviitaleaceae bacterium]